jgi:hypothetical protein
MTARYYKAINHYQSSEISVSTYYTSYNSLLTISAGDDLVEISSPLDHIDSIIKALIEAKADLEYPLNYSPALRK